MPPTFGATWGSLRDRCEELPEEATLVTTLSRKRFRITDVQNPGIVIEDTGSGDSHPLQREQFEILARHVRDAKEGDADDDAGIDPEQVLGIDREKVDEALDVVSVPETPVYESERASRVRRKSLWSVSESMKIT
jgi:hypothetical protein